MNQVQILRKGLDNISFFGQDFEVETLVATYVAAKESIAELTTVQSEVKANLAQIIRVSGIDVWETHAGKVTVPADATIITYDAGAIDRLAADNVRFRNKVWPFRRETVRAGGIRIATK